MLQMSHLIRPVTFASFALVVITAKGHAQDSALRARYDSLEQRMVIRRYPCPKPVPVGWVVADSANGQGIPCSLIAAAARGAKDAMIGRRTEMDPYQVLCVTLSPAEPLPPYGPLWRVVFYTDSTRGAVVTVNKTGHTITGMMIVPLEKPYSTACKRAA